MQNERTESREMNIRICTLIMRGLSATEATLPVKFLSNGGRSVAEDPFPANEHDGEVPEGAEQGLHVTMPTRQPRRRRPSG